MKSCARAARKVVTFVANLLLAHTFPEIGSVGLTIPHPHTPMKAVLEKHQKAFAQVKAYHRCCPYLSCLPYVLLDTCLKEDQWFRIAALDIHGRRAATTYIYVRSVSFYLTRWRLERARNQRFDVMPKRCRKIASLEC